MTRGRSTLLKKLIFSILTSLSLVLCTPFITQASPLVYSTERLSGQDSVETALKISQKGWDSAQTVILCESSDYPDSIAATPFAVSLNAPILLTQGTAIDTRVVNELQRLKPQKVILLGGTACLSPAIEKGLETLAISWERIGGIDRYETSILLAKHLTSDSLILANGDDFPDALSAATFAGIKQIPIVLTSYTLPESVIRYYQETAPTHLIVIGGEVVVPSSDLAKNHFTVETRLGGQDRYGTNAKVVSYMKDTYQSNDLFLASGITFPDAVAGTVLASKNKAPLLLTEKEDIPPSVYSLMREHMKIEPLSLTPSSSSSSSSNVNILFEPQKGQITASGGLKLRDTPSSTGQTFVTIPKDTTIELLDQQDNWYKTTYQAKTGWVSADYVTPSGLPQKGNITASGGLNLRETPTSTGKALITIPHGTTIEVLFQQGQWYKTTYQAKTGWLSADYVTLISKTLTTISSTQPATNVVYSTSSIDLSVNGTVYILGGQGIISTNIQSIIEGKASSKYQDNLKSFPPLPSEIKKPETPSPGDQVVTPPTTPPVATTYDPSTEILLDPFEGIPANALAGKTIVLDPGHGGPDTGALGPNHTYEKTNTLAIALALNDILKQSGANVILTRTTDISPASNYTEINDLQARVTLANNTNPDVMISIHNDSCSSPDVQGTSTYYSEDNPKQNESIQLANCINTAVTDTAKTNNRGIKQAAFYVLRNTTMPSVLLEAEFISSPYAEARLHNPTFQKNLATAIFHGIYQYFKTPLPQA